MPPQDWELILVNNASTDCTAEIIDQFIATVPFHVAHLYDPNRGSGSGKNLALVHARGRILAFTDDDCCVRPDFLPQIVSVFAREDIGYLGGLVILPDSSVEVPPFRVEQFVEPYSFVVPGFITGANMAILRSACDGLGGHDPLFGAGAVFTGEDKDLAARASWAGWRGKYDPRPAVSHLHGRSRAQLRSRMREYARGRGAYYAKFLLDKRTRAVYARAWFWSALGELRQGDRLSIAEEALGAVRYLLCRVTSRTAFT
jgi:cellulose synthase/poly-beta-1,6-N-acetylglucosamine synthase-like glycosyltransferase